MQKHQHNTCLIGTPEPSQEWSEPNKSSLIVSMTMFKQDDGVFEPDEDDEEEGEDEDEEGDDDDEEDEEEQWGKSDEISMEKGVGKKR